MSINIEMQIKQANSTYETLYPSTLGSLVSGKVSSASQADSATSATSSTTSASCTGNSATATKLATARSLQVYLNSTSSQSFDGSSDATSIGVSGTLPVARGGTGYTSLSSLASALSSYISVTGTLTTRTYTYTGTRTGSASGTNNVTIDSISGKTPTFAIMSINSFPSTTTDYQWTGNANAGRFVDSNWINGTVFVLQDTNFKTSFASYHTGCGILESPLEYRSSYNRIQCSNPYNILGCTYYMMVLYF